MKHLFYILIFIQFFLISCSKVQESAGVTRKSIDEFQAVENAPLVIPPDFNLISPDKIQEKDIDKVEKELAIERLTLRSVVQNRLDDKHDSVLKRIEVYEQKTKPVIEYFKNKKVLFEINGASSMKIVSKDILNIISDKMMLLKSEGS